MRCALLSCTTAALLVLTGCDSSGTKPSQSGDSSFVQMEAGSSRPTFTRVFQEVLRAKLCGQVQCHGAALQGDLQLSTQAVAYRQLVGVAASGECVREPGAPEAGAFCGCARSGLSRVVEGDPDNSLLVMKLSGNPPCGERMPPTGEPISTELLDLVKQWIQAGALDD